MSLRAVSETSFFDSESTVALSRARAESTSTTFPTTLSQKESKRLSSLSLKPDLGGSILTAALTASFASCAVQRSSRVFAPSRTGKQSRDKAAASLARRSQSFAREDANSLKCVATRVAKTSSSD